MKPYAFIIFSLLLLALVLIPHHPLFAPPEVRISNLNVSITGLTNSSLNITMSIYNPNKVPITVTKINYSIYGNGNVRIENDTITRQIIIPADTTEYILIHINMRYATLKAIWGAMSMDKIEWKVTGKLYMKIDHQNLVINFQDRIQ